MSNVLTDGRFTLKSHADCADGADKVLNQRYLRDQREKTIKH